MPQKTWELTIHLQDEEGNDPSEETLLFSSDKTGVELGQEVLRLCEQGGMLRSWTPGSDQKLPQWVEAGEDDNGQELDYDDQPCRGHGWLCFSLQSQAGDLYEFVVKELPDKEIAVREKVASSAQPLIKLIEKKLADMKPSLRPKVKKYLSNYFGEGD